MRDGGPGIPAEAHERIFRRFERASGDRPAGGLGLGLYLARQIARAHGGDLSVRSDSGPGATFVLELPARAAMHGAGMARGRPHEDTTARGRGGVTGARGAGTRLHRIAVSSAA